MRNRDRGFPPYQAQLVGADGLSYGLQVHQATGMVAVQSNRSVMAALALLVDHAAQQKRSVAEIALAVLERRLRLEGDYGCA